MSESALYGQILLALSRGNTRLFRQNAGVAWQGKIIEQTPTRLILAYPRAIKLGTPGISDLGGLTSVVITPEQVGQRVAIYLAIEGKGPRTRTTPEQVNFIAMVRSLGGRAGIARTVDDAALIISGV